MTAAEKVEKVPRSKTAPERTMTAFRAAKRDIERIDEFAREYGMSRTAYILAASLQELPHESPRRLEPLEDRVARLEAHVYM